VAVGLAGRHAQDDRSAWWKREANSLSFSHVAVSIGVIDSPETPFYLALIALAWN
jgi:hypothetical protein